MIKNILISILLIIAGFLFFNKGSNKIVTKTKTDTLINYKSFIKIIKGDKIPYKVINTIHDTIHETIHDTSYIIKNYSQIKEYIDTIQEGQNTYTIKDTISQNKIVGRSFQAQIHEKTITITNNIVRKPQPALYVGIRSDLSNDMSRLNHNLSLSFKTAKKGLISVGYGMSGFSIGYDIKL